MTQLPGILSLCILFWRLKQVFISLPIKHPAKKSTLGCCPHTEGGGHPPKRGQQMNQDAFLRSRMLRNAGSEVWNFMPPENKVILPGGPFRDSQLGSVASGISCHSGRGKLVDLLPGDLLGEEPVANGHLQR